MDMSFLGFSGNWFSWGLALIIGFPLIVIVLGELMHQLDKVWSPWAAIVRFIQRFIIPQLVLLLITTKILELPPDHLIVKVVETLLWIFIIYASISALNMVLFTDSEGSSWRIQVPKLLQDLGRVIIVALGSALVLSNVWGFELGKMLAALGVGSIVLGLALQDTFSSLFSGFALISSKQFRVGDWLEVNGSIGKIVNISWRSVTLLNRDEDIIIIPNSDLAKGKFVNFSHPYPRHVERVNFDFSFNDAPYKVKRVLTEAALNTDGILHDPPPVVDIISYDVFSVRHQIRFCIEHYVDLPKIRDRFLSSVWYIAKREGVTFPNPAHEVIMMKQPDTRTEEQNNILACFQKSPLLHNTDPEILQAMAEHSRIMEYGKGDALIRQGVDSDEFFIIMDGEANEYYRDISGQEHQLNTLTNGDILGLISLVRNSPDEVTVRAAVDTTAISIDERHTRRLLQKHPELTVTIERLVEKQQNELRELDKESQELKSA